MQMYEWMDGQQENGIPPQTQLARGWRGMAGGKGRYYNLCHDELIFSTLNKNLVHTALLVAKTQQLK